MQLRTSYQKIHHPTFSPSINRFDGVYRLFLGSVCIRTKVEIISQLKYNVKDSHSQIYNNNSNNIKELTQNDLHRDDAKN